MCKNGSSDVMCQCETQKIPTSSALVYLAHLSPAYLPPVLSPNHAMNHVRGHQSLCLYTPAHGTLTTILRHHMSCINTNECPRLCIYIYLLLNYDLVMIFAYFGE